MNNLKEYLNQILFLEKTIYAMNILIDKYDNKIKYWPMPNEVPAPDLVLGRSQEERTGDTGISIFFALVGSVIGGTIFNIVFGGIIVNSFFDGDWNFKTCGITYIVMAILIFAYEQWFWRDTPEKKREEINQKKMEEYERKVEEYKKEKRIENEKRDSFVMARNIISNNMHACKKTLESLYSVGIIYPKYRNFVAVASFCEYLNAGRCSSLEGHEGAYNIFENEIRQDVIISQLSEVIRNLESIRNNQYMVYQAVKEGNLQAEKLYQSSLKQLELENINAENLALTEYNTRITAYNTSVMKDIALYKNL